MEHDLLQLLHLPPDDHLMVSSDFFDVGIDGVHFTGSVDGPAVVPGGLDDCGWVEDLMQLGEDLFGGDGEVNHVAGTGDHHQPWSYDDDGSPDGPPRSQSMEGDGSPPSGDNGAGELATERQPDDDDVSAATRKRRDRSKTIVSERKRRVRMKEKLYELRALVPNITKMDKASIIADAVEYVKNLQSHARKLKDEVATLQARPRSPGRPQQKQQQQNRRGRPPPPGDDGSGAGSTTGSAGGARVTRVGATQVGDGTFFVTVECERRDGVTAPLCAAVESLACFRVENSSLGRSGQDRVVSTLTLKASDRDAAIGAGTVKLWVMAALVKEGFRHDAAVEIS